MTTWGTIKDEIQGIIEESDFKSGGDHEAYLLEYANDIVLGIANVVDFDRHLKSGTMTLDTSTHIFDLPSDFLKKSRTTEFYVGTQYFIPLTSRERINSIDPDHSEITASVSGPSLIAFEKSRIHVYAKWAGTLSIQDYYSIPTEMVDITDTPDLVSAGIADDRLIKQILVDGVLARVYDKWLKELALARPLYESAALKIQKLYGEMDPDMTAETHVRSSYSGI